MGRTLVVCLMAIVGCSKSTPGNGGGSSATPPANDPCSAAALGLGSAKQLTAFQMPDGCSLKDVSESIILRNDADAAAHVACTGAPLGVDFKKSALVVKQGTLSPAATGILAYDTGKIITWVTRFRSPCPKDPQPMPVPVTLVFAVEADAGRGFDDKNCTVTPKCD